MRGGGTLLALGLVLVGSVAWAQPSAVKARAQDPEHLAPFGLLLDAGIPEGAGLSVFLRPTTHVRVHLGATHNGIRLGGRVGVTLLPLRSRFTPTVSFEVGHALAGNASTLARRLADSAQPPSPSLDRVGYTYASTHLGIEFGETRHFTFFLRGGVSWGQIDVPNVEALREPFLYNLGRRATEGGRFLFLMPSAKLGFLLYFG